MATHITKEEDNFLRIVYLNYRVGTTALRRYFDSVHPNLPSVLSSSSNKAILASLHTPPKGHRRILYKEQWNILYPPSTSSGSQLVSSADLDVTIMVCLLRNLPPPGSQPLTGFDVLPPSNDLSPGAHIVRIKYYKNFLVSHSKDGKLGDVGFNTIWIDMEMAINGLGNQQDVKDATEAKFKSLDYNSLKELVHLDRRLYDHTNILDQHTIKIAKLETTVEVMEKEVQLVKKDRQVGTPNDFMTDKITKWEKDDILYIETRATKHVLSCISEYKCVSVIGPSGCGKTALVQHVALQLQRNGYTICTVDKAKQIKKKKSERKTLYIVDDMCGNFTTNQARLEKWKESKTDIEHTLQNCNCKLLFTCRLQVFQDEGFEYLKKIFKIRICDITSLDLSLTNKEKIKMTTQFFGENALKALKQLGEYECLPLLCQLYYGLLRDDPQFKPEIFLNEPFSFYKEDLDLMYYDCHEGKCKYYILLLLVIFNNQLEEKQFSGNTGEVDKTIKDIVKIIDKDENITVRNLRLNLKTLTGTFLKYNESYYKCIHDRLFDFLAVYFGGKTEFIKVLIKLAKPQFVQERFSVAEENKKSVNDSANYLIPVLKDTLHMYLIRVYDDLVVSSDVNRCISGNINFKNVKFNSLFLHYMKHLEKKEIDELMQSANSDFFYKLFVAKEHDIRDQVESWYLKYQLYGIVIPGDMIQLYTERLFDHLTKTHKVVDSIDNCRPLKDLKFRSAMSMYISQLNTKVIASVMQTASRDFFNRMFVMTEYDIKDKDECRFKCIGIVIPENLLHEYIELWFEELKKADDYKIFLEKSRPLENFTFRTSMHTYITKLNTNIGVSLIRAGNEKLFNEMFVMTKHDIDDNGRHWSLFGMVIPDDILNQYIERWLDYFTQSYSFFHSSRPCRNPSFVTAVRKYMRQLSAEKIASIIQTSSKDFLYHGFVMTEDEIKEDSRYIYERFGIIISSNMLKRYIERWFRYFKEGSYMKKLTAQSRLLSNLKFRTDLRTYIKELRTETIATLIQTGNQDFLYSAFVISEDDINWEGKYVYELFGIVIPNELLKSYIERSFLHFKEGSNIAKLTDESKLFSNGIFRAAVRAYINEFTTEKIASLIQTESKEFLNRMFIISENDIKDNAKYAYACFGIVIPVIMLQQYIERWFNYLKYLTNATQLKEFINNCRPLMNGTFRTALRDYIRRMSKQKIASLIQDRNPDFVNTMFVMSEDDIEDSAENQYESFGILIPYDLLQQYIERWLYHLTVTNSLKGFFKSCRPLKNVFFRIALHNFFRELSREKIANLINTSDQDFIRRMFVMSEDDISDTGENCYNYFGIVVPDDLLHFYIEKMLKNYHGFFNDNNWIYGRRHMMNLRFRTAVRIFIGQLSSHRITELPWSVGNIFWDEFSVMTIDDMHENDEVTDYMLKYNNHKIERLLDRLSETDDVNGFIDNLRRPNFDIDYETSNDMIRNQLSTGLSIYTRQVRTAKISDLIRTGTNDFLDRMFVITKDEIKDTSRYEFFGIVIPDNLKQQYIERWFNGLTEANSVRYYMSKNRPLKNVTFRSSVRTYMRELNTEQIAALIQNGNDDFLNEMFVMTDAPIVDNLDNLCECFGFVVPVDSVQHYVERLFHRLANTKPVKEFFNTGRYVMNNTFLTALRSYMRHLNVEEIAALIRTGSSDFINTMFVMTEEDIKDHDANRYDCLAIVIPDDMLQLFVERLFNNFAKSDKVTEFMESSRPLVNAVCRTTMCSYIRQLNRAKIFSLMQTVSGDFLSKMFVITEEDIECNAGKLYGCIGIVIPSDLLEHYIKCWIQHMIETSKVNEFMNSSRTLMNGTFRTALRTYMRQLNIYKMDYLIQTVSDDFFEKIFEMSKDGSEDNDILAYYIERWFERLTKVDNPKDFMDKSRHLMNDTICTALRSYMKQLSTEKVAVLIQSGNKKFFNTMFVVSDNDIKDNAKSLYECFGIVIPDSLLQLYIESWLERITKTTCLDIFIYDSRPLKTDTFRTILCSYIMTLTSEKIACIISTANDEFFYEMFVITDSDSKNLYESLSIVVPGKLLQYFFERWLQRLNNACWKQIEEHMQENRQLMNETFCAALRSYMRHLSIEQIATLIQNGHDDFVQNMFVVMEDDIKEDSNIRYECFGIVIPNDLLRQYIQRWFNGLSKYNSTGIKSFTNGFRPLKNIIFRVAVQSYIQQLNPETISSLVNAKPFHNSMFVMAEDDFKYNDENLYESVGIVIPGHLLQQYIELWFKNMTTTDEPKDFLNNSRPLKNITYITALRIFMKQLNTCKIASLIQNIHEKSFNTMSKYGFDQYEVELMHNRNDEFLNTMFVMTEDDLKDKGDFLYERVGIVIPSDLVQYYLEIWFEHLTKTSRMEEFMNESRPLMNSTFRTALQIYMRQLKTKKVDSLIKKVSNDFMNKIFVMTEDDINDNNTNRCECFGIIIPCDLLQVYIKRWFVVLTKSYTRKDILNSSRPWRSVVFRNGVRTYMRHMNTDEMKKIIKKDEEFFQKMFVMIDDDFNDNTHNPDDLLQHCIETWFSHLTRSGKVKKIMEDNRPFLHVIFRTTLRIYMEQLKTEQIDYFIQTGSSCFVNTMFVMKEYDIKDNAENSNECFGIVLPVEMLQKYIEKWFDHLTKSDCVKEFINENRPLMHVTVITAVRFYLKQLTTERISSLIQTGSSCFINTMFVMTEDDIKDNAENRFECFGIVIPDDLLLQYIEKWFPCTKTTTSMKEYLNYNRLLMNDTFRLALRAVIKDSKIEDIAIFIQNTGRYFLNIMFVMTADDIKNNAEDRYECFGWVIPDSILLQYIEKWVNYVKTDKNVMDYIRDTRPLISVRFKTALLTYLKQLTGTEEIRTLIENGSIDFLNKMFVMTEDDINDKTGNEFEWFGIVIPCQLLQEYIRQWIKKISRKYRDFYKNYSIKMEIEANRPMKNLAFRTALCTYIRRLSTQKITTMFTEENRHFMNAMYVMSDDDIKDITTNRYDCIGIVIPDGLVRRYIKGWFNDLSKTDSLREFMKMNRPLMNVRCQSQLRTYIRQLNGKALENLIQTASADFVNLMFVMIEDDIKYNATNRYEWFGIVIPDGLLYQYIRRWFDDLTQTDSVKKCIDANRCVKNETFRKILQTYIRQINEGTIISLIQTGSRDFVSTMFVTTERDIKDNATVNLYECFGIVIPDSLLHQYIERRFNSWTQTDSIKECIDTCRVLVNVIGWKAMQNYIRQINEDKIGSLVHTGSRNFINTMFVMTEDDIRDNADNRYECFGIVLPENILHQYIARLFDGLTKADSVEKCIDVNRCFKHGRFRTSLDTYTKKLSRGKIGNLIRSGSRDFVNTMFFMTENDITNGSEKRNKSFGIVIPDDLLNQYIERWFDGMTKTDSAKHYIDVNRTFMNSKFQANLDLYINGINSERIKFLNRKGNIDFLNTRRDLFKETS